MDLRPSIQEERSIDSTSFLMVTNQGGAELHCTAHRPREIKREKSTPASRSCKLRVQSPKAHFKDREAGSQPESGVTLQAVIQRIDLSDASDGTAAPDLRKSTIGICSCRTGPWNIQTRLPTSFWAGCTQSSCQLGSRNSPPGCNATILSTNFMAILDRRKRQVKRERPNF